MSVTPFDPAKPAPMLDLPVGMYERQIYKVGDEIRLAFMFENLLTLYGLKCFMRNGVGLYAARPEDPFGFRIHPIDTVESVLAKIKEYEESRR